MKIYEAQNYILIHTDSISPSGHRHMAAHIIVSLDNNIKVYCDDEYWCKGILIPADKYHEVDIVGNNTIVFLYECSSDVAKQINDVRIISDDLCQKIKEAYTPTGLRAFDVGHMKKTYEKDFEVEICAIEDAPEEKSSAAPLLDLKYPLLLFRSSEPYTPSTSLLKN